MKNQTLCNSISKNINEAAEFYDYRQADIHRMTGMDKATISRIFSGERMPTVEQVIQLKEALHLRFEDVLIGT